MSNRQKQLEWIQEEDVQSVSIEKCLDREFSDPHERRIYYNGQLQSKINELKTQEFFPIGDEQDIVALSDSPFYTVAPNPWINDFISLWKKNEEFDDDYTRTFFAGDVSEGKSDPVYNAHSYHTKVPPKAIVRYLLHYTKPGDVVYDGFCGTGMTGVAASMCGDKELVKQLGYRVDSNDDIFNEKNDLVSKVGVRRAILGDLSPIATFIAKNYNMPIDINKFEKEASEILEKLETEFGWMYETLHENGEKAKINYLVWSQAYSCPHCAKELIFTEVAVKHLEGKVLDKFKCPGCHSELNKKNLDRIWETKFDKLLGQNVQVVKEVPFLINYTYGKDKFFKKLDEFDYKVLKKIDDIEISYWLPLQRMPKGDEARRNDRTGLTHVHHFYTKRNLVLLAALKHLIGEIENKDALLLLFTSHLINLSKLNRFRPGVSFPYNPLSGTLYIGSQSSEANVFDAYKNKIKRFSKAFFVKERNTIISTSSQVNSSIQDNSIDYIFTDPPFGANIMYSELSFIWEAWLGVLTNNKTEAIINKTQNKDIEEYKGLMLKSFQEYYRVLKPGRWITVEFSNSKASVWNAIQEAIQKAGFIITNVSALDKKLGSFKAVTTTTAVKQDLIISAFKPTVESVEEMVDQRNTVDSAWTYVKQYLETFEVKAEFIPERTPRIIFDKMVAYHVQNGLPVPISSPEFQVGVTQRFPMRDGMAFLDNQVAEYDKKRISVKEFAQMNLFVSDENSAIEWIRQQLLKKPQTRQDLHPNYMKEIQHIAKHELLPELDDLLHQNFLFFEGDGGVPDQIVSYLRRNYKDLRGVDTNDLVFVEKAMNRWYVPDPNKQADLEKLREKSLLREFSGYVEELESSKKKLKQFRTEAIRAGFKKAYSEKEFDQIVKVGDRLPEKIIQEDDKLLMYYDNACIRLGL
ncbi:DNA methylase [Bacillus mycoides]|uniref:DNA methyltransferase n=1 Tax=Bacillus mycoides TaxID=1405 RepID=UPI00103AE9EF|nr:DNA methyltransferase [Bacillus mycoides]TBX54826.1 DNA methylase [Bacillus mycoides]